MLRVNCLNILKAKNVAEKSRELEDIISGF